MKKPKRLQLDMEKLREARYFLMWSYILANRHPDDPQLALVLGFAAGKLAGILRG